MAMYQLFKTPNAYYVFDAVKTELLRISEETYHYIKREENTGGNKPEELLRLKEQGFLSDKSPVEQFRHPYMGVLHEVLTR